jgi:hypothetical protein
VGWLSEDYKHEGWAAFVLRDGRIGSASCGAGVVFGPWDKEQYRGENGAEEIVPWSELAGWQTRCQCGWAGQQWQRQDTTPVEYKGVDPEDALANGALVEEASRQDWDLHAADEQLLQDIEIAAQEAAAARHRLDQAVAKARAVVPPKSWEAIGRKARMSRQSAHERWGRVG